MSNQLGHPTSPLRLVAGFVDWEIFLFLFENFQTRVPFSGHKAKMRSQPSSRKPFIGTREHPTGWWELLMANDAQ